MTAARRSTDGSVAVSSVETSVLAELAALSAADAARRILGATLIRDLPEGQISCRIVEVEAYDQDDPASHSFGGPRERNRVMFGSAGVAYVYLIYGMHHCVNVVTGPEGIGAATLIRAVEPIEGAHLMRDGRPGARREVDLSNGPGKLCQALQLDRTHTGHDLTAAPLRLILQAPLPEKQVTTGTRIGITKAADVPWRFYVSDSGHVSRR